MDTMRGKSLLGVTIAGEPWLEENVIREKKRLGKTLFMGVAAVVCVLHSKFTSGSKNTAL